MSFVIYCFLSKSIYISAIVCKPVGVRYLSISVCFLCAIRKCFEAEPAMSNSNDQIPTVPGAEHMETPDGGSGSAASANIADASSFSADAIVRPATTNDDGNVDDASRMTPAADVNIVVVGAIRSTQAIGVRASSAAPNQRVERAATNLQTIVGQTRAVATKRCNPFVGDDGFGENAMEPLESKKLKLVDVEKGNGVNESIEDVVCCGRVHECKGTIDAVIDTTCGNGDGGKNGGDDGDSNDAVNNDDADDAADCEKMSTDNNDIVCDNDGGFALEPTTRSDNQSASSPTFNEIQFIDILMSDTDPIMSNSSDSDDFDEMDNSDHVNHQLVVVNDLQSPAALQPSDVLMEYHNLSSNDSMDIDSDYESVKNINEADVGIVEIVEIVEIDVNAEYVDDDENETDEDDTDDYLETTSDDEGIIVASMDIESDQSGQQVIGKLVTGDATDESTDEVDSDIVDDNYTSGQDAVSINHAHDNGDQFNTVSRQMFANRYSECSGISDASYVASDCDSEEMSDSDATSSNVASGERRTNGGKVGFNGYRGDYRGINAIQSNDTDSEMSDDDSAKSMAVDDDDACDGDDEEEDEDYVFDPENHSEDDYDEEDNDFSADEYDNDADNCPDSSIEESTLESEIERLDMSALFEIDLNANDFTDHCLPPDWDNEVMMAETMMQ